MFDDPQTSGYPGLAVSDGITVLPPIRPFRQRPPTPLHLADMSFPFAGLRGAVCYREALGNTCLRPGGFGVGVALPVAVV